MAMPHRFYIPRLKAEDAWMVIEDKPTLHQITHVLRLKKNDTVTVFTARREYDLVIRELTPEKMTAVVQSERQVTRRPERTLHLYASLLKKNTFEWILQKATELGVSSFTPLVCSHTIVRSLSDNKRKRYEKIITEATEQCGGAHPPPLQKTMAFDALVKKITSSDSTTFLAWEGDRSNRLGHIAIDSSADINLIIGPEGGFTPDEIDQAQKNGIQTISLGPRILRAETAAIAATTLLLLGK